MISIELCLLSLLLVVTGAFALVYYFGREYIKLIDKTIELQKRVNYLEETRGAINSENFINPDDIDIEFLFGRDKINGEEATSPAIPSIKNKELS